MRISDWSSDVCSSDLADGHHLMTDVWTSAGVIAGVAVVALTGWTRLDAVIAALVALNILWAGWKIMHDSVAGLMDTSLPPEEVARIEAIIAATRGPTNDIHELRTRDRKSTRLNTSP